MVQNLIGEESRSSHCCFTPCSSIKNLLNPKCCAGAELEGHLERTRQSLLEELITFKGRVQNGTPSPMRFPGVCPRPILTLPTSCLIFWSTSASVTTWTTDQPAVVPGRDHM